MDSAWPIPVAGLGAVIQKMKDFCLSLSFSLCLLYNKTKPNFQEVSVFLAAGEGGECLVVSCYFRSLHHSAWICITVVLLIPVSADIVGHRHDGLNA